MQRRELITLLGGTAASWPFAARAQQQPLPVVGYLSFTSPDERPTLVAAFHQGLGEAGFFFRRNLTIEYRSAGRGHGGLPLLAAEQAKNPLAAVSGPAAAPPPFSPTA